MRSLTFVYDRIDGMTWSSDLSSNGTVDDLEGEPKENKIVNVIRHSRHDRAHRRLPVCLRYSGVYRWHAMSKHVGVRHATCFRSWSLLVCTHTHQTVLGPDTKRELTPLLKLPGVLDAVFLSSSTTAGESMG